MKAFALTGNIGCGKSTVATLLSEYQDVVVLDCDRIAKEIVSREAHKQEITTILGKDVCTQGQPDFKAIASIIFGDLEKKKLFEAWIHPLTWRAVHERVEAVPEKHLCVVESAILYETGSDAGFAAVIVATCNEAEQQRRLEANRGMSRAQIDERLIHQLSSKEKEARAQFVIHTDCSMEELRDRVARLYGNLKQWKGVQS